MARPQAFERELKIATAGLEPDAIRALLAKTAKEALSEAQRSGDAPANFRRFVNGREGVSEEQVNPPGPIVYEFSWLPEITEYGLAFWKERAPKESGDYARSVIVLVNGRQTSNFTAIAPDAEVVIVATVPYARKVEVGAMKMRVPPGIAQDTRQAILRRFGNVVQAEVRFINLAGGYVLRRNHGRAGRRAGQEVTYPAVIVTMRF